MEKEEFQPRDRVRHRMNGHEGTVLAICPSARRRIEWDDDRITVTHVGDLELLEAVD